MNTRHHYIDDALLLQQHRRSAHEGDPSPVPDHDDEDAGCEECLHGKPHLGEASVLMDALGGERNTIRVNYFCRCNLFYWQTRAKANSTPLNGQICLS